MAIETRRRTQPARGPAVRGQPEGPPDETPDETLDETIDETPDVTPNATTYVAGQKARRTRRHITGFLSWTYCGPYRVMCAPSQLLFLLSTAVGTVLPLYKGRETF